MSHEQSQFLPSWQEVSNQGYKLEFEQFVQMLCLLSSVRSFCNLYEGPLRLGQLWACVAQKHLLKIFAGGGDK